MKRRKFIQVSALSGFSGGLVQPIDSFSKNSDNTLVVKEPAKEVPVSGQYDVVVSGAGPAGVIAAIEAGRNGAKVLLLEIKGCLGGVWTSGLLSWILDQEDKPGIMRELESRLENMNAKSPIDTGKVLAYDVEKMKVLLEMMCQESNVDIQLHTSVVGSVKDNHNRLTHVITESKSGREAWEGKVFIDASGDGDLAALSGCGFDFGSEQDGTFQPMSLLAVISGIQFEEVKKFIRWAGDAKSVSKKHLLEEIVSAGVLPSYTKPSIFPIHKDLFMIMANHEYGFSGLNAKDVTKATIQGRQELHKIIDGLKYLEGPWKNLRIVSTAEQIGVREGRRIHGLYTVTKEDLIAGVRHKDAVCRVNFGVDVHSVKKENEDSTQGYNRGISSKPYDIPLRALIAKDVGGLLMAGRCISGDFISHSSYRVTGNAVAMGQAAGRVAAIAAISNKLPKDISWSETGLSTI
ncbi:FAD-dependent oxidoreductase [uncultured Cyclobacterium sp.]|uniref:FAD-dependent oxidoreductase n=1 Tax=uncultured Cyclobacterium sp. TaxID=453820 RepID=UPI0030EC8AFC|tara:strand:+ start:7093 stop:8478 length:1386 start_codon:yes stop_codon:yes gene_type:complete